MAFCPFSSTPRKLTRCKPFPPPKFCSHLILCIIMSIILTCILIFHFCNLFLVIYAFPQNQRLFPRSAALRNSPSGGYAPVWVNCPANLTVRLPTSKGPLNSQEQKYIEGRTKKSIPYWRAYLERAGISNSSIDQFLNSANKHGPTAGVTLPNVAMALSGGGARAALVGASIMHAFDGRNEESVKAGTGGLLQVVNYVAGLSGGSWFTGSWATSNYPEIRELVKTWSLTHDNQPFDWETLKKYPPAVKIAREKADAGFPASLVDVWSLMVGKHFVNAPNYGKSVLFSSIQEVPAFKNHDAPFPVVVATSRGNKGRSLITLQTPIYEFTPYEFGTWHPSLNAFIPLEYLGTSMFAGKPIPHSPCVKGFDNAGFVMGSSSNVLSEPFMAQHKLSLTDSIISGLYEFLTNHIYDEALVLNPFNGLGTGLGPASGFPDGKDVLLYLADGGFGGENMPIWPLIQQPRKIDCIFAVDAQADGNGNSLEISAYANGTSLYTAYAKTLLPDYSQYKFPKVPDYRGEFTARGLHQRTSFFGCEEDEAPLVVYFPNHYVVAQTDYTSSSASYTEAQIDGFFANGFAIATQKTGPINDDMFLSGNLSETLDRAGRSGLPSWSTCVACAVMDRQLKRDKILRSSQCQACFLQYCA